MRLYDCWNPYPSLHFMIVCYFQSFSVAKLPYILKDIDPFVTKPINNINLSAYISSLLCLAPTTFF